MSFRFVKRDVGKGHRPTHVGGDCTVRALALATGLSWDAAWQKLYDAQGRYRCCGFALDDFLDFEPELWGVVRAFTFPAVKGQRRMNGQRFAEQHPRGSFILRLAHHLAAVEDGVLYDTWDCSQKCVYTAWQIRETK